MGDRRIVWRVSAILYSAFRTKSCQYDAILYQLQVDQTALYTSFCLALPVFLSLSSCLSLCLYPSLSYPCFGLLYNQNQNFEQECEGAKWTIIQGCCLCPTYRQTDGQTERQTNGQTDTQPDEETSGQTQGQLKRWTDWQGDTEKYNFFSTKHYYKTWSRGDDRRGKGVKSGGIHRKTRGTNRDREEKRDRYWKENMKNGWVTCHDKITVYGKNHSPTNYWGQMAEMEIGLKKRNSFSNGVWIGENYPCLNIYVYKSEW